MSSELDLTAIQARQLYEMGVLEHNQGNVQSATEYYLEAKDLYLQTEDFEGIAECCNQLANICKHTGRYDESMDYFQQALSISNAHELSKKKALVLANMGTLFNFRSEHQKAVEHWEEALRIHRQNGDVYFESICLGDVATAYLNLGQILKAKAALEGALKLHREIGNRRSEGITLHNLGNLNHEQGRLPEALQFFEGALSIHRELENRQSEGITLGTIGILYAAQGRFDEAETQYRQALTIHEEIANTRMVAIFSGYLGDTLAQNQQLESGLELLDSAQQSCEQLGDRNYSSTFLYLQAERLQESNRARAIALYEQALEQCIPGNKAIFSVGLAHLLALDGKNEKALEVLVDAEEKLSLQPTAHCKYLYLRSRTMKLTGDSAQALQLEEQADAIYNAAQLQDHVELKHWAQMD